MEKQRNHNFELLAASHFPPLHRGAQAISLAFFKEDVFSNTTQLEPCSVETQLPPTLGVVPLNQTHIYWADKLLWDLELEWLMQA